jgi:glucokinase
MALTGGDAARINPELITNAARAGDSVSRDVIEEAAAALASGLANLAYILVPEVIVLGGGVMRSFDLFQPTINDAFSRLQFPLGDLRITSAALGMDAGVIGAARAVLDRCFAKT